MKHIPVPVYLLDDEDIKTLLSKAMEIATELAGESDTPELPVLIEALREELAGRGARFALNDLIEIPSRENRPLFTRMEAEG